MVCKKMLQTNTEQWVWVYMQTMKYCHVFEMIFLGEMNYGG